MVSDTATPPTSPDMAIKICLLYSSPLMWGIIADVPAPALSHQLLPLAPEDIHRRLALSPSPGASSPLSRSSLIILTLERSGTLSHWLFFPHFSFLLWSPSGEYVAEFQPRLA